MPKRITGFYRTVTNAQSEPASNVDQNQSRSTSPQDTHQHANKALLDQLGVDENNRLTKLNSPINPPLIKEQW